MIHEKHPLSTPWQSTVLAPWLLRRSSSATARCQLVTDLGLLEVHHAGLHHLPAPHDPAVITDSGLSKPYKLADLSSFAPQPAA